MINLDTWKKAWALLDAHERRNALITLAVVILSAFSSAADGRIGSAIPVGSVRPWPNRAGSCPCLGL